MNKKCVYALFGWMDFEKKEEKYVFQNLYIGLVYSIKQKEGSLVLILKFRNSESGEKKRGER